MTPVGPLRCAALGVASITLFAATPPAHADQEAEARAQDLVYEAADAVDAASEQLRRGEQNEADHLLDKAEDWLDEAEIHRPGWSRIGYERARLYRVDGQPDVSEEVLLSLVRGSLDVGEHLQAVELLDLVRADQGLVTMGTKWRRAERRRDVGVGFVIGGAALSIAGYALSLGSLADATYAREEADPILGQVGRGLAAGGGGFALGGAVVLVGGELELKRLRAVLPGPWRLRGARKP